MELSQLARGTARAPLAPRRAHAARARAAPGLASAGALSPALAASFPGRNGTGLGHFKCPPLVRRAAHKGVNVVALAGGTPPPPPPPPPPSVPTPPPRPAGKMVKVKFNLPAKVGFGVGHHVVGSIPELGDWDTEVSPAMEWQEGHVWEVEVMLPAGETAWFKYARVTEDGGVEWEDCKDHLLIVPEDAANVMIGSQWNERDSDFMTVVSGIPGQPNTAPTFVAPGGVEPNTARPNTAPPPVVPPPAAAGPPAPPTDETLLAQAQEAARNIKALQEQLEATAKAEVEAAARASQVAMASADAAEAAALNAAIKAAEATKAEAAAELEALAVAQAEAEAEQAAREYEAAAARGAPPPRIDTNASTVAFDNDPLFTERHSPTLDTTAMVYAGGDPWSPSSPLTPGSRDDLSHQAQTLLDADAGAPGWQEKLEAICDLIAIRGSRADPETVCATAVYLPWLASGLIPCDPEAESTPIDIGAVARDMFECCERMMGNSMDQIELQILRKIHCSIPYMMWQDYEGTNALATFQARIAGLDLGPIGGKVEALIKRASEHASPSDRAAAESLVTALGQKWAVGSPELKQALEELSDDLHLFHNAASLDTSLMALQASMDNKQVQVLRNFIRARDVLLASQDSSLRYSPDAVTDTLQTLTHLRAVVCNGLGSGLRNDCPEPALAMRQRWRMAEIQMEKLAGVLVGEMLLASQGPEGRDALEGANENAWLRPLQALLLGVRNLGLSGWEPQECMVVELEIVAWQRSGAFGTDPESARRIAATLERLHRLVSNYLAVMEGVIDSRRDKLGAALGMPPNERMPEDTSKSLPFQVSHLCEMLLRAAQAVGANPELPFSELSPVRPLAPDEGVFSAAVAELIMGNGHDVLPIEAATTSTCGSKAESCAILSEIGHAAMTMDMDVEGIPCGFATPPGKVLPFGGMEAALLEAGLLVHFEDLLDALADAGNNYDDCDAVCTAIQSLILAVRPGEDVLNALTMGYGPNELLIARPSPSVDDLSGGAVVAGPMYEAVPGVPAGDRSALGAGIARVWASLYNTRSVFARRAAGVPDRAVMAVLVQQYLSSQYAFTLRSRSPASWEPGAPSVVRAEVCVGNLAAIAQADEDTGLVSGGGDGWRIAVDRETGHVTTEAFANLPLALVSTGGQNDKPAKLVAKRVDYSNEGLSVDPLQREKLGKRLYSIGTLLEREFGTPVVLEGALSDGQIHIVQIRPQP